MCQYTRFCQQSLIDVDTFRQSINIGVHTEIGSHPERLRETVTFAIRKAFIFRSKKLKLGEFSPPVICRARNLILFNTLLRHECWLFLNTLASSVLAPCGNL